MSDISNLSELARFVGRSKLDAVEAAPVSRKAAAKLKPKTQRHSVADLLGAVLALSARTRRLALPKVEIDLDVFSPEGRRAVRLLLPR